MADRHNQVALASCAEMFSTNYFYYGQNDDIWLPAPSLQELRRDYDTIIALDNVPGAGNLYSYRPPTDGRLALFVGNERRGLTPQILRGADVVLALPMARRGSASLNVAGATAAALWQLHSATWRVSRPHKRPDIVFANPNDPAQLGSALRSAWAFGWGRVGLIDSALVWFTKDRATFAEGRGAARRHKTPLKVYTFDPAAEESFNIATVITASGPGKPLWQAKIATGRGGKVFIPDESMLAVTNEMPYLNNARHVQYLTLGLPGPGYPYHLLASIALAELAR